MERRFRRRDADDRGLPARPTSAAVELPNTAAWRIPGPTAGPNVPTDVRTWRSAEPGHDSMLRGPRCLCGTAPAVRAEPTPSTAARSLPHTPTRGRRRTVSRIAKVTHGWPRTRRHPWKCVLSCRHPSHPVDLPSLPPLVCPQPPCLPGTARRLLPPHGGAGLDRALLPCGPVSDRSLGHNAAITDPSLSRRGRGTGVPVAEITSALAWFPLTSVVLRARSSTVPQPLLSLRSLWPPCPGLTLAPRSRGKRRRL